MYEKYSTTGCVERLIQHKAKPSAVFASRHSPSAVFFIHTCGGALTITCRHIVLLLSCTPGLNIKKVSRGDNKLA